jgi:hypothetical protein
LDLSEFIVFDGLNSGISDLVLVFFLLFHGFESVDIEEFLLVLLLKELVSTTYKTSFWMFSSV